MLPDMAQFRIRPVALTIAGSDSGGGAGLQADLKTFAACGVHGTTVVTSLTAQNPRQILATAPCPPKLLRQQLEAVFSELRPAAIKTGLLTNAAQIRLLAEFLGRYPEIPLVVDPVMVATSGRRLLVPGALSALCRELLPRATLVTPNLPEAAVLSGGPVQSIEAMRSTARRIHDRFGCAVLVKGGHLDDSAGATDCLFDGKRTWLLKSRRIAGVTTHGTGCTLSAAICAALARGENLADAVKQGKKKVTQAIRRSYRSGNHWHLG
jgi:hydroxymethylpyrimidine kinase/phosphomethylpyrimidine kinase